MINLKISTIETGLQAKMINPKVNFGYAIIDTFMLERSLKLCILC